MSEDYSDESCMIVMFYESAISEFPFIFNYDLLWLSKPLGLEKGFWRYSKMKIVSMQNRKCKFSDIT